jgi:hypothetical protein
LRVAGNRGLAPAALSERPGRERHRVVREPLVIDTAAGLAIARVPAALISISVQSEMLVSREIGGRVQPGMRVSTVAISGLL